MNFTLCSRCLACLVLFFVALTGCRNAVVENSNTQPNTLVDREVEASCGECQFGMEGNGCDLAVRIDGETYYVDGASIDDHGDAHGEDGMCNCVRKAKVNGAIENGRFVATSFEVLPQTNVDAEQ